MTTTFSYPTEGPAGIGDLQVIFVGVTTTTFVAAIDELPVRVSFTVAPARNPVPTRFVMVIVVPCFPDEGVMPVTVGGVYHFHCIRLPGILQVIFRLAAGHCYQRNGLDRERPVELHDSRDQNDVL